MAPRGPVAGDVRCPDNPRRLFVRIDPATNLIEILCRDCTRQTGARVFHRYNIAGELIETEIA